jgi:hypothetical protein
MTALSEDKILRLNCPGFGVSSILPLGEAKPLAMYDVIVVNPTSVLHLFDNKSDAIKQIEVLQADGMTSYRAETDAVIEGVTTELDLRTSELAQFLKKGGLLIFFLTPPFSVSGPTQVMDNYSWLGDWCPDKPSGPNQRNMSATIRGKAIETCVDAAQSPWIPYLKQQGIEWSTIIRLENLSEGWTPLANAGPNKCIAGFKASGAKGGQVVFLPAPYDASYDVKLKECIERWHAMNNEAPGEATSSPALADLSRSLSSLLSDDEPVAAAPAPTPVAPEPAVSAAVEMATSPMETPAMAQTPPPPADVSFDSPTYDTPAPIAQPAPEAPPEFFSHHNNGGSSEDAAQPQELINKMKQEITRPYNAPDWCQKFSFEELDGLRTQLSDLNEEIRLAKLKAQDLEMRIDTMEDLKNSLLSASGEQLVAACTRVFERLGWTVKPALGSQDELWLVENEKTQAIVRLNYSTQTPNRAELAALAESVITYWGAHEIEPKGILVASTWADKSPMDRPDEDFPESMAEFAKRKNLCLLTTAQLLSVFRDLDVAEAEPKEIRENLLTTSGRVLDYAFSKKGSPVARK